MPGVAHHPLCEVTLLMEYKLVRVNLLVRHKFAVVCVIAVASLTALLLRECSTDSKTTHSYDPSSTITTYGTPAPFMYPTSTPSPVRPRPSTPVPAHKPVSGYNPEMDSEESIRLHMRDVEKSITYEKLKKNADEYDSYGWEFTGKVSQIQESGGRTAALVSLDAWGNKTMWVTANFTTEFVEKDQVYVVGYLAGNYSYTSVAGWNMTVPAIEARAILKPAEAARIRAGKPPGKK